MPDKTRKLSYRKDDRAMHPIYECPENFRESLTMPTATFPEIFNGLFFRLIQRICVQNLKFVALPVPEIISKNLETLRIRPRSLFSKIFNGLLFGWTLSKFEDRILASPVPDIIAIGVLSGGCEPPILGKMRP